MDYKKLFFIGSSDQLRKEKVEVLNLWTENGTSEWWERIPLRGIKKACSNNLPCRRWASSWTESYRVCQGKETEKIPDTHLQRGLLKWFCSWQRLQWWEINNKREAHHISICDADNDMLIFCIPYCKSILFLTPLFQWKKAVTDWRWITDILPAASCPAKAELCLVSC